MGEILPGGLEKLGGYGTPGWDDIVDSNTEKTDDHIYNHPATANNLFWIWWEIAGSISTGTEIGGYRIVPFASTIQAVFMSMKERGQNGNTIVDINQGDPGALAQGTPVYNTAISTIYTTPANRPNIAGSSPNKTQNAALWAESPDIVACPQYSFLSLDVDSNTIQSYDLIVAAILRKD